MKPPISSRKAFCPCEIEEGGVSLIRVCSPRVAAMEAATPPPPPVLPPPVSFDTTRSQPADTTCDPLGFTTSWPSSVWKGDASQCDIALTPCARINRSASRSMHRGGGIKKSTSPR